MMAFPIWQNYRKDRKHPPGHGYGRLVNGMWVIERPGNVLSLVIHSTNGNKGSSLTAEAKFLRDSPNVSCHDLIGKDGTIVEILPPTALAWHAGDALAEWMNEVSLGIELHHAEGDSYPQPQIESLTWRVQQHIQQFGLPRVSIETHRAIAIPRGRKPDPSDWSDSGFYAWRKELYQPDWAGMWGSEFPYFPDHGFPSTWRALHLAQKSIGRPLSAEHDFIGKKIQLFEKAILTWTPTENVRVYRGEF